MSIQDQDTLKGYFNTGDIPSESNFADLIDSSVAGNWTDYSATSTIVGWSLFVTKVIEYKAVGRLVFVRFTLTGTSNDENTSFTLPYTSASGSGSYTVVIRRRDNGNYDWGIIRLLTSSNVLTCYTTVGAALWTNSGTKEVYGEFWYEAAP